MLDRELGSQWEGEVVTHKEERIEEGKGLFLSLSTLVIFLFVFSAVFVWYMIKPRLSGLSPHLLTASGFAISLLVLYISLKFILAVISAATGKNILPFLNVNYRWVNLIYLYAVKIGNIFGISKDRIGNSFVKFNNALVIALKRGVVNERLLVLLPRCLQNFNCKQKVAEDINNCKDCGKCEITKFKELQKKYRFNISIATGGSLARKMIYRVKPSTILAVACERELVSGIQDTKQIRVLAIPNLRPEGPCKNTRVDMAKVENAISFIFNNNENINLKNDAVSEVVMEAGARG